MMIITTAIFDMDGLLIDSEPLWHESVHEALEEWNVSMSEEEYASSIGLRTHEFLHYWLPRMGLNLDLLPEVEKEVTRLVRTKIEQRGEVLPGVHETLGLLRERGLRIGLATSSPVSVIKSVLNRTGLHGVFEQMNSAEMLPHGKPHPQVYLDCAAAMNVPPVQCLCFEDSFYGLIAAKSARMHCVVVPAPHVVHWGKWQAADLVLNSLTEFTSGSLDRLMDQV